MTTVSAGSAGSLTLPWPQTITITPAANGYASFEVLRGGVLVAGGQVRSTRSVGPFLGGDVFTVTAQRGAADYTTTNSFAVGSRVDSGVLYRTSGGISGLNTNNHGHHLSFQAPAAFDGVRLILISSSNTTTSIKASVCAPAYMSGTVPKDSGGTSVALTAVTWGASDPTDFRSVGGVSTASVSNASGSGATLREGYAVSDYLALPSSDRTDIVGAPPVICIRLFGTNVATVDSAVFDTGSSNPANGAIPQLLCGYWGADYTANPDGGSGSLNQQTMPAMAVIFYLRGQMVSLGVAGDSIEMGWCNASLGAVDRTMGDLDGWGRKLSRLLTANGTPTSFCAMSQAGESSYIYHERSYNALLTGGLTHLFVKPWSINDGNASTVPAALSRTTQLLDLADRKGVAMTLIRPWAGQATTTTGAAVQTYCDQVLAAGGRVFDARSVIERSPGSDLILESFQSHSASRAVVDTTHPNDAAHTALAACAYRQRAVFGI